MVSGVGRAQLKSKHERVLIFALFAISFELTNLQGYITLVELLIHMWLLVGAITTRKLCAKFIERNKQTELVLRRFFNTERRIEPRNIILRPIDLHSFETKQSIALRRTLTISLQLNLFVEQ